MRQESPACERNVGPIVDMLGRYLPGNGGQILEVGSGPGQHLWHFARAFPDWQWWPTDAHPELFDSIRAWTDGLSNVQAPQILDLLEDWPLDGTQRPPAPVDATLAINVLHIAPTEASLGLISGSAQALRAGGRLIIYGPFKRGGKHTAPSNEAFDARLRERNPLWGLRDVDQLESNASEAGLSLLAVESVPANNFMLIFEQA